MRRGQQTDGPGGRVVNVPMLRAAQCRAASAAALPLVGRRGRRSPVRLLAAATVVYTGRAVQPSAAASIPRISEQGQALWSQG